MKNTTYIILTLLLSNNLIAVDEENSLDSVTMSIVDEIQINTPNDTVNDMLVDDVQDVMLADILDVSVAQSESGAFGTFLYVEGVTNPDDILLTDTPENIETPDFLPEEGDISEHAPVGPMPVDPDGA